MKNYFFILTSLLLLFISSATYAQGCSMCKAVAETSVAGGNTQGAGLNAGILYIMVFPYILIGVGFYLWYRHKQKIKAEDLQNKQS